MRLNYALHEAACCANFARDGYELVLRRKSAWNTAPIRKSVGLQSIDRKSDSTFSDGFPSEFGNLANVFGRGCLFYSPRPHDVEASSCMTNQCRNVDGRFA